MKNETIFQKLLTVLSPQSKTIPGKSSTNMTDYKRDQSICDKNISFLSVVSILILGVTMVHSTLFQKYSATSDFLHGEISFPARSKIECGSRCYQNMNKHSCTAFSMEDSSGLCICGKKQFAPVKATGSTAELHIGTGCIKIKTGRFQGIFPYVVVSPTNVMFGPKHVCREESKMSFFKVHSDG